MLWRELLYFAKGNMPFFLVLEDTLSLFDFFMLGEKVYMDNRNKDEDANLLHAHRLFFLIISHDDLS